MARGKFNKRGGGKRVDAQSADEIEQRNQRLAEFEENRAKRRAEEEEEEEAENGGVVDENGESDGKPGPKSDGSDKGKGTSAPVQVTSAEDHKKNLAKLEIVRKRREQAEARRKAEEEAELAQEMERKTHLKDLEDDDSDDGGKKKKKSKAKEIPKLTKIEIKKMKPSQMKDALKERGLDIQGNKNALTARLLEYEGNR